jgi:hypothetical protein
LFIHTLPKPNQSGNQFWCGVSRFHCNFQVFATKPHSGSAKKKKKKKKSNQNLLPTKLLKMSGLFFKKKWRGMFVTTLLIISLFATAARGSSVCSCLCRSGENTTATSSFDLACDAAVKCADQCASDTRCGADHFVGSVQTCQFACATFNASVEANKCLETSSQQLCDILDRKISCAKTHNCTVDAQLATNCASACAGHANATCAPIITPTSCAQVHSCTACQAFSSSCLWCDYGSAGGRCWDTNTCPSVNAAPQASALKPNSFTCGANQLNVAMSLMMMMTMIAILGHC